MDIITQQQGDEGEEEANATTVSSSCGCGYSSADTQGKESTRWWWRIKEVIINTPSLGKSPKNKGPDFPGFEQTDITVAASSSHLHHDIRTRSRILASRVITCE
eukprot:COSAG06_NODE_42125_length_384_cov_1.438596_1_plen_103_part_01